MAYVRVTPTTPGRRHMMTDLVKFHDRPFRGLITGGTKQHGGRNNAGRVTVRHRGGGEKRRLRIIDWSRDKRDVQSVVERIEYDPNRTARIALLRYMDGERRYIVAPESIEIGQSVVSGDSAPMAPGNCLPLGAIPVGTPIHNIELRPGKGGQIVRSAGQMALIQSKEAGHVDVKLPSGELRRFHPSCRATIGQVSNVAHNTETLGKAGRRRHMGWRPEVRGVAMNPRSHPHGGGEGRSGIGMKSPKSPWGKRTLGKKTRRKKYSNKWILKDRRMKE